MSCWRAFVRFCAAASLQVRCSGSATCNSTSGEPCSHALRSRDLALVTRSRPARTAGRNPRRVVSREQALAQIWHGEAHDNVVYDRYVSNLRRKLGSPQVIETVRGVGFVLGRSSSPPLGACSGARDDDRGRRPRLRRRRPRCAPPSRRARPHAARPRHRGRAARSLGARAAHDPGGARLAGRSNAGDGPGRRQARPDRRALAVARGPHPPA